MNRLFLAIVVLFPAMAGVAQNPKPEVWMKSKFEYDMMKQHSVAKYERFRYRCLFHRPEPVLPKRQRLQQAI